MFISPRFSFLAPLALLIAVTASCGDDAGRFETNNCGDFATANCVEVEGGDSAALLAAVNSLVDDTTVVLGPGEFVFDNQVTIRNANTVYLVGQGIGVTTLSFSTVTTQINGVDVVADDFLIQDLTVLDAPKDGIRVENSDGVVFRRIETTWTTPGQSTNGAYGIYPVRCVNVLVEDSIASNASDAGLYVGQCINVNVRGNRVEGNVAGLEIENTQYADVYDNHAENNTAGIVVFDLPGNPVVGRDVRMRDNVIINNNLGNFAPGGIVGAIPAGTGTFVMASRRVIVENNTYTNNNTFDIAIVSGQIVEDGVGEWDLETSTLVGDWEDLGLLAGETAGTVSNFRSEDLIVRGNTHMDSGDAADLSREFGQLAAFAYDTEPTPDIIYDGIGESTHDATTVGNNSNDNNLCIGGHTGSFSSFDFPNQPALPPFNQPLIVSAGSDFGPFECDAFSGDPLVTVSL